MSSSQVHKRLRMDVMDVTCNIFTTFMTNRSTESSIQGIKEKSADFYRILYLQQRYSTVEMSFSIKIKWHANYVHSLNMY